MGKELTTRIKDLERINGELSLDNQKLKNEISLLNSEVGYGLKNINVLKELVMELQDTLGKKEYELSQKNRILEYVSQDLERFSKEIDTIISYFELSKKEANKESLEKDIIAKSQTLGHDRELMFGINVDEYFLQSASIDMVKYYLYAIGCTKHLSFDLKELVLKSRYEMSVVGKAFSEYIKLKSKDIDINGVIQVVPTNLFSHPTLEFWGNRVDTIKELFGLFSKEYNLQGELRYAVCEAD